MQLKKHSLLESCTNLVVGYTINLIANFAIFPWFGWHITLKQNITIGVFYTVISLIRSYCLRRIFTRLTEAR
jgi:hypothetical protein